MWFQFAIFITKVMLFSVTVSTTTYYYEFRKIIDSHTDNDQALSDGWYDIEWVYYSSSKTIMQ
jgi:hypothetical protein